MADDKASLQDPSSRTLPLSPGPMELGFQANLGPLSQTIVQLFSPETAVWFATSALGWWKGRQRIESLQSVLSAAGASLAPIGAFNSGRYSRMRSQNPVYGVARQEGGRLSSLQLPKADNSTHGNTGVWCLYAMITALLCFFNEDNACAIIMDVLPNILHYDQDDQRISKEGPLYAAVKATILQVAEEEKISKVTEGLLRHIEERLTSVSTISLGEIRTGGAIDSKLVSALLLWLSVDYSKRKRHLYPTRSFLVWAIAEILKELGFAIHVSDEPITTEAQYNSIFEDSGRYTHELEVHFVPSSVGRTDPDAQPRVDVPIVPHVRLIPIQSIPVTELRQHFLLDGSFVEEMSKAWVFTFTHVQNYLRSQSHITDMIGSSTQARQESRRVQGLGLHRQKGLQLLSKQFSRSSPESLEEMLAKPVKQYILTECGDCVNEVNRGFTEEWCWTDDAEDDAAVPRQHHNRSQKLMMKAILLATAYAIACLFVKDGDKDAGLNTEVAYTPSLPGNFSDCFSLELDHREWVFRFFSIAAVGKAQKGSTRTESGRVQFTKAVFSAMAGFHMGQFIAPESFGGYSNGISVVSNFLLDPSQPFSYHRFAISFGRPVDLPLDENNIITSVVDYSDLPKLEYRLADAERSANEHGDSDVTHTVRWDVEPDWARLETSVHFRSRVNGVPQAAIPPLHIMRGLEKSRVIPVTCTCEEPTTTYDTETLTEYNPTCDILFIPFRSIRRNGRYMRITLVPDTQKENRGKKRTVVVINAGKSSVEQWLALYTDVKSTSWRPIGSMQRLLGSCFRCGIATVHGSVVNDVELFLLVLSF